MVKKETQQNIVIYKTPEGISVDIQMEKETIWLDARHIAEIFGTQRPAIVKHLNNIYKTGELERKATCSILEQVANDGKIRKVNLYNFDAVLSVGYRVNSKKATQFRVWATSVLKKHLIDGYAINEKRLKEAKKNFYDLQSVIQLLGTKISSENLKGQEQEIFSLFVD